MRVIAGEFGGRRLKAPPGSGTRPTPERVREALFSALGDLAEARVLDLYAGSGALAIEALSRGAASAVMVERDGRAAGVIAGNVAALGLGDRADLRRLDAVQALGDAARGGEIYDLVLIDPPYRCAETTGPRIAQLLSPLLSPTARVVTESDRRSPLELPGLPLLFERRYGDTLLRIHASCE